MKPITYKPLPEIKAVPRALRRKLPIFFQGSLPVLILESNPRLSPEENHNMHVSLVRFVLLNSGKILLPESFETPRPYSGRTDIPLHGDPVMTLGSHNRIRIHTSDKDASGAFVESTGSVVDPTRNIQELYDEGSYNPDFTSGVFYSGTIPAGNTTLMRWRSDRNTVHGFKSLAAGRNFWVSDMHVQP